MSIASTYFIKAQVPTATLGRLLALYQREIEIGGASETSIVDNTVEFSGSPMMRSRHMKFCGFVDGRLIIEETETEYLVYLEAESPKWIFLFDVYFETLRNDLERELQAEQI